MPINTPINTPIYKVQRKFTLLKLEYCCSRYRIYTIDPRKPIGL